MEVFSKDARVTARMLTQDQPITKAQRAAIIRDLTSYRESNKVRGKPMPWATIAENIGLAPSVVHQTINGTYKGDEDRALRMIDQFLASEDQQSKRPDIRGFQKIRMTEHIVAAINQALTRRSIGVITGEPGSGKSVHARWFLDQHDGAVLITCDDADCDAKFVIDELHKAFGFKTFSPHARGKKREIEAYLQSHRNTVILVDESQKLTNGALEMLRGLHDKSDPEGRRNVPVILFGDEHFYSVIVRSRAGDRTPISPQITSRFFPVISLERDCLDNDEDGTAIAGTKYSRDDIDRIVKGQRLKLFRPDAIGFAVQLANLPGHGALRLACRVMEIAIDIKRGPQVTVEDLRSALVYFIGPSEAKLVREQISAEAPRAAAKAG